MRKFKIAVLASPVEVVAGLVMIGGGLGLNAAPGWPAILGSFFAVLGGVLASWGVTKTITSESATEGLSNHLKMVQRRLATVSGQIGRVARDVQRGACSAESGAALIMQSTGTLSGVVSDLEDLSGERFSPEALIATLDRVLELTELEPRITQLEPTRPEMGAVLQEMESLRSQIRTQIGQMRGEPREYKTETVACVDCGVSVPFKLGTVHGDSAMPACDACGTRFHAHRDSDGTVFTRRWGGFRSISVTCPECGNTVPVSVNQEDTEAEVRFCVVCGTRLTVDPTSGELLSHEKEEILAAMVVRRVPRPALLQCPACQQVAGAFISWNNRYFAVCSACNKLLASPAEPLPQVAEEA